MIDKINLAVISACVGAMVYMFNNFASGADLERLEARQIRGEIRELCYKYITAPPDAQDFVGHLVMETVEELCDINPEDRRCEMDDADEVCNQ